MQMKLLEILILGSLLIFILEFAFFIIIRSLRTTKTKFTKKMMRIKDGKKEVRITASGEWIDWYTYREKLPLADRIQGNQLFDELANKSVNNNYERSRKPDPYDDALFYPRSNSFAYIDAPTHADILNRYRARNENDNESLSDHSSFDAKSSNSDNSTSLSSGTTHSSPSCSSAYDTSSSSSSDSSSSSSSSSCSGGDF